MAKIVREANGLDEILVGAEGPGNRPPDLCDLQSVRQACAEVVPFVVYENLGLVFEAAEGGGMDDPVAIPLEGGTVIGFNIQISPPLGILATDAIGRERLVFEILQPLAVKIHGVPSSYAEVAALRMGRVGVEPTRCFHRRILSPLRLPIPPSPRGSQLYTADFRWKPPVASRPTRERSANGHRHTEDYFSFGRLPLDLDRSVPY